MLFEHGINIKKLLKSYFMVFFFFLRTKATLSYVFNADSTCHISRIQQPHISHTPMWDDTGLSWQTLPSQYLLAVWEKPRDD